MTQEITRAYWRFTVFWMIAGCGLGVVCALALFSPDLVAALPALSYGRMAGAHRTAIVYGFFFSAIFASAYMLLPKLGQYRVVFRPWSLPLAWIGSFIILTGVLSILAGHGSGQEYADFPPIVAILFWLYLLAVALDLGSIAVSSRVLVEHPSLALLLPATLLPAIIYPFLLPDWWGSGLFASMRIWISIRSLFILSFTLSAIALAIALVGSRKSPLVIPRGAYLLAIGLIVGFGPFLGVVNLLDAPISSGLKAWGAFSGIAAATGLLIIVWILSPRKPVDLPSFYLVAGFTGLGIAAIQGIFMVIPPVHTVFHYTANTSAHAHLALGALAMIFLGGAFVSTMNISGVVIPKGSKTFMGTGLVVGGLSGVIFLQLSAGIIQATAFKSMLGYPDWSGAFRWLYLGVGVSGLVALSGLVIIGLIIITGLRVDRTIPLTAEELSTTGAEASEEISPVEGVEE